MNPSGTIDATRPDRPVRPLGARPGFVCDMTADSIPEPHHARSLTDHPTPATT
jgi:hypothetical protein